MSSSSSEWEALEPQLQKAQETLEVALEDACSKDVRRIDTGELIKIDESLAIASKAAKEAVSVRLRLRREREAARQSAAVQEPVPSRTVADVIPAEGQRVFDDLQGIRWRVMAVRPSVANPSLPEPFRQGWLSFQAKNELRRSAPIPAEWEELPIDELRLLCSRAEASSKRTTSVDVDQDPRGQVE